MASPFRPELTPPIGMVRLPSAVSVPAVDSHPSHPFFSRRPGCTLYPAPPVCTLLDRSRAPHRHLSRAASSATLPSERCSVFLVCEFSLQMCVPLDLFIAPPLDFPSTAAGTNVPLLSEWFAARRDLRIGCDRPLWQPLRFHAPCRLGGGLLSCISRGKSSLKTPVTDPPTPFQCASYRDSFFSCFSSQQCTFC